VGVEGEDEREEEGARENKDWDRTEGGWRVAMSVLGRKGWQKRGGG